MHHLLILAANLKAWLACVAHLMALVFLTAKIHF